jgi:hypothetical protein
MFVRTSEGKLPCLIVELYVSVVISSRNPALSANGARGE